MPYVCESCGERRRFHATSYVIIDSEGTVIDGGNDYDSDSVICSNCNDEATWLEGREYEQFCQDNEDPDDGVPRTNGKIDIDKKLTGDE